MERNFLIAITICAVLAATVSGAALDEDLDTHPLVNKLAADWKEDVSRMKRGDCCSCGQPSKRSDDDDKTDSEQQNCCACPK